MGTDLTTIKRESNLLKKNDNIVSKPKKKLGRKKIEDESLKMTEKVTTYIAKSEKEELDKLVRKEGVTIAQYLRKLVMNNKSEKDGIRDFDR
tara:strand:+ start:557 stop:832 length:276 start_codon:yes stop_codon:yes gene_type:complete